jgi:hypothetical protein
MPDTITDLEHLRFERIKVMKIQKLKFRDMVEPLRAEGLLTCQNCTNGTPRKRASKSSGEVCRTCENTLSVFWKRNITRLADDDVDLLEVKWEWIEGKRHLQRIALERSQQRVVITTTRRETVADDKGNPVTTEYVTERVENRIYPELLRLYDDLGDDIARINGLDTEDPESLTPSPRSKVTLRLPAGSSLEDFTGDGSDPS